MSNTITVVALIKAKPGKEKILEEMLKGLVRATHLEPGCKRYILHRSAQDPGTFVFIERWKSPADLQSHLESSHVQAALAQKEELIDRIDIIPVTVLAGGNPAKEILWP